MCHTWFENINYPLEGLDLDGVDNADGHTLEHSDNSWTLWNELLIKKYKWNMCHTWFENINYPLVGLDLVGVDNADGHPLEHSDNSRTLWNEILIKNTNKTSATLDLKTLTTHLLDSTWLALTTPMGVP